MRHLNTCVRIAEYTTVRGKTCARRRVWRDIMGAAASAADPNITADEHFLGRGVEKCLNFTDEQY